MVHAVEELACGRAGIAAQVTLVPAVPEGFDLDRVEAIEVLSAGADDEARVRRHVEVAAPAVRRIRCCEVLPRARGRQ